MVAISLPSLLNTTMVVTMSQQQEMTGKLSANLTSDVMVVVVVILFIVFVVLFFLYLNAKHYHGAMATTTRTSQVHFFISPPGQPQPHRGLDPAILRSLPVTVFHISEDAALECPVCLCELTDGEKARMLPTCKHGFHVECIDMWFHSNDTCPLCRTPVSGATLLAAETNVAARIVEGEGSSSAGASRAKREGMLVIEIPRRMLDGVGSPSTTSSLPLSRHAAAASPMSARLRSLRRMLSGRGSMVAGAERASGREGADIV